jgi:hypothetical protein
MLADNKEFLKFGDVIYLNSKSTVDISLKSLENSYPADAYKPNAQHPNNNVLQGYLAAKGFLDEKIYFLRTHIGLSLHEQDMPNLLNARDCHFVVVPKLRHDFHSDLLKCIEEYKKISHDYDQLDDMDKAKHKKTIEKYANRVVKAQHRATKEQLSNKELMLESYGQDVSYGQEVQLMHADSEMFICAKDECSETERIGYKIELSRFSEYSMVFQLLPRFKSREVGERIQYGDSIYIENLKTNHKLSISDGNFEPEFDLSSEEHNPLL